MYSEDVKFSGKEKNVNTTYPQTSKILHSARELSIITNSIFQEQKTISHHPLKDKNKKMISKLL